MSGELPKKTIDLPLDGSLSQKTEQEWLAPGSAAVAQNTLRNKTGASTKRFGLKSLGNAAVSPGKSDNTAGQSVTITSGSRLGTFRQNLITIARDAWTDAVFQYDEGGSQAQVMLDRVPEVYVKPYEPIAGSSGVVGTVDTAIVGAYEVHAWVDPSSNASCQITTMVRDVSTGEMVQPPTLLSTASTFAGADRVRLVVCGIRVVMTFGTPSPDWNTYGCVMQPGPGSNWTAPVRLNQNANDSQNWIYAFPNAYDVASTIGVTNEIVLLYMQKTGAATAQIRMSKFSVPGLANTATTTISPADATWTADYGGVATNAGLTGVAIRSDSVNNEIGFAYSWKNGANVVRLSTGLRLQSNLASTATPVDLAAGSLLNSYTNPNAAVAVTIERIGTVGASSSLYKIRASPGVPTWVTGSTLLAGIASFIAGPAAGAMTQVGTERRTYGVQLWSRDFVANGIAYLVGYVPSNTQGSFFLFADDAWSDVTSVSSGPYGAAYFPLRLVGNIAPRLSNLLLTASAPAILFNNPLTVAHMPSVGSVAQTLVTTSSTAQNSVPTLVAFDFSSPLLHQSGELGQNAILANGSPSGFDGTQAYELAFPVYPVIQSITFNAASGSLNGAYSYIATYEWTDSRGQLHRSGRSVPLNGSTGGAGFSATVVIGVCGFTAKEKAANATTILNIPGGGPQGWWGARRQVTIKLWRTQASGTIYNFVGQVNNIVGAFTVSIIDTLSDAQIQANPLLYGDGSNGTDPGSILDNLCAPAAQAMVVHKQRVFMVDGPRVWVSKAFTSGEGSGFNEATAFSVDDGPGNLTALASLDDKLVLFKRDRLFYITGEGPADNGTSNDFSPPQRIASDVGCIDWRSVVSTAQGVYFMSVAGRRLLTRDLQVQPVPVVEDIDAANPAVTSGVIHPAEGRVLWTQNTDDTSSPRTGVLVSDNYVLDAWTTAVIATHTSTDGMVSSAVANAPVGSALVPTYHTLDAGGAVWRQKSTLDTAPYEDFDGSQQVFAPTSWQSPWIKSDGLQGWSHWNQILLFLVQLDPAALVVTVAYDYNPTPVDTHTYTAAQYAAYSPPQIRLQPTRPRSESMRITINDFSDTGTVTGQGYRLVGVRVDYGVEPGGYRVPVAQQS